VTFNVDNTILADQEKNVKQKMRSATLDEARRSAVPLAGLV